MCHELDFQRFKAEDYPAYYHWFQDCDLNRFLGPMQEEEEQWLAYVLDEQAGRTPNAGSTWSIFLKEELVAVVGIVYPNDDYPVYGITSIAVKPSRSGQGLGRRVLQGILARYPLQQGQSWVTHVDRDNARAKLFFERNGWECTLDPVKNNGMFLLEYRN